jgi:hypothetical protein
MRRQTYSHVLKQTAINQDRKQQADRQKLVKKGSNKQTDSHVSRQAATSIQTEINQEKKQQCTQTATYQDRQQRSDRQQFKKTGSNKQTDSHI